MGCFDTVMIHCPRCKKEYDAQSKAGDCLLYQFELEYAPADVLLDVTQRYNPMLCECGCQFALVGRVAIETSESSLTQVDLLKAELVRQQANWSTLLADINSPAPVYSRLPLEASRDLQRAARSAIACIKTALKASISVDHVSDKID